MEEMWKHSHEWSRTVSSFKSSFLWCFKSEKNKNRSRLDKGIDKFSVNKGTVIWLTSKQFWKQASAFKHAGMPLPSDSSSAGTNETKLDDFPGLIGVDHFSLNLKNQMENETYNTGHYLDSINFANVTSELSVVYLDTGTSFTSNMKSPQNEVVAADSNDSDNNLDSDLKIGKLWLCQCCRFTKFECEFTLLDLIFERIVVIDAPTDESEVLGEGAFGIVYQGVYKGQPVAIKSLKLWAEKEHVEALKYEYIVMRKLSHHLNLVSLVGKYSSQGWNLPVPYHISTLVSALAFNIMLTTFESPSFFNVFL